MFSIEIINKIEEAPSTGDNLLHIGFISSLEGSIDNGYFTTLCGIKKKVEGVNPTVITCPECKFKLGNSCGY